MSVIASTVAEPSTTSCSETETLPPYHVVLLNDDDHSVDYVTRVAPYTPGNKQRPRQ